MRIGNAVAKWTMVLYVPFMVGVLLISTIAYTLFQPQVYKQILVEQNFYPRFNHLAAEQLVFIFHSEALNTGNISFSSQASQPIAGFKSLVPYLSRLSGADWQNILTEVLPSDWVQTQYESVVDQIGRAVLYSGSKTPIKISMVEVKASLQSDAGMTAILRLIDAQPSCATGGGSTAEIRLQTAADPLCKPSASKLDQLKPSYRKILDGLVSQIPDQIDLIKTLASIMPSSAWPVKSLLLASSITSIPLMEWIQLALFASLLIPVVFVISLARLAGWTADTLLRRWGTALLAAGLLGSGLALAGLPALNSMLTKSLVLSSSWYVTSDLVQILLRLVESINLSLARWLGFEAYILIGVGAVFLIGSIWALNRRLKQERIAIQDTRVPEDISDE